MSYRIELTAVFASYAGCSKVGRGGLFQLLWSCLYAIAEVDDELQRTSVRVIMGHREPAPRLTDRPLSIINIENDQMSFSTRALLSFVTTLVSYRYRVYESRTHH